MKYWYYIQNSKCHMTIYVAYIFQDKSFPMWSSCSAKRNSWLCYTVNRVRSVGPGNFNTTLVRKIYLKMFSRVPDFNLYSYHRWETKTESEKGTNQPRDPRNMRGNKLTSVENAETLESERTYIWAMLDSGQGLSSLSLCIPICQREIRRHILQGCYEAKWWECLSRLMLSLSLHALHI